MKIVGLSRRGMIQCFFSSAVAILLWHIVRRFPLKFHATDNQPNGKYKNTRHTTPNMHTYRNEWVSVFQIVWMQSGELCVDWIRVTLALGLWYEISARYDTIRYDTISSTTIVVQANRYFSKSISNSYRSKNCVLFSFMDGNCNYRITNTEANESASSQKANVISVCAHVMLPTEFYDV